MRIPIMKARKVVNECLKEGNIHSNPLYRHGALPVYDHKKRKFVLGLPIVTRRYKGNLKAFKRSAVDVEEIAESIQLRFGKSISDRLDLTSPERKESAIKVKVNRTGDGEPIIEISSPRHSFIAPQKISKLVKEDKRRINESGKRKTAIPLTVIANLEDFVTEDGKLKDKNYGLKFRHIS